MPAPAPRLDGGTDLPIGGPSALDRPIDRPGGIELDDGGGPGDESAAARRWAREQVAMRADRSNSIMRMPPQAELRPPDEHPHRGSVAQPLGLGALAGAVRPHRRLPPPPVDPLAAACS